MSQLEQDSIYETPGGATYESRPIGEYLRRQRILRGLSAEELAQITRIPLRSLLRLESGHFDGETDGFVRGFVRTVAVALGLDTDDTVARMLQEPQPSAWERHGPGRTTKQIFAATVFLLLLGCVYLGVRATWSLILGDASRPVSREVVVWRDPVHALAEATGQSGDPIVGIDRGIPAARMASAEAEAAMPPMKSPSAQPARGEGAATATVFSH